MTHMKILTYLLLALMAGLTGMNRITSRVHIEKYFDEGEDTTETSYTVNLLDADSSSKYFHDIMPVLDTIVKNEYAQMYFWEIWYSGDTLHTHIQNWAFDHFKKSDQENYWKSVTLHGALRYSKGNDSKIFFVLNRRKERENEFLNKTFHMTDSLFEVEIEYKRRPPKTFFGICDIMTIFRFLFADNHICDDMYFTYNSNLISLKPDSVNGLTVIHSDNPRKRRLNLTKPSAASNKTEDTSASDSISQQSHTLSE